MGEQLIRLSKPEKAAVLFEGWQETLIWSALEGEMGCIWALGEEPGAALCQNGDFLFLAGKADEPEWATMGITDGCWMYTTKSGDLLMTWSNFGAEGYVVATARSSNGRLDGEWIHEELLYKRSMTVEDRYDGGHAMTFTARDGQMYLSFHSPNGAMGERRETPVFLAVREEGGRLVWDESCPAHN